MLRTILIVLIYYFSISNLYATTNIRVIKINDSCINISKLININFDFNIQCNMNYGDKKKISKQWLNNILIRNGINNIKVKNDFIVERKGKILSKDKIRQSILKKLQKNFPDTKFEITKINIHNKIYTDDRGYFKINFIGKNFGTKYINIFNGIKNYRVLVYVKAYKEVFVTTEHIKKGNLFNNNLIKKEIEITNLRYEPILKPENFIAKRNIAKNKPLTKNYVIKKPINFSGETVKLIYKSDNIKISTIATLEENAYIGKKVRLKNTSTGKIIYAKAVRKNKYYVIY